MRELEDRLTAGLPKDPTDQSAADKATCSRARALAIVVACAALLAAVPRSPAELRMVNGLCEFVALGDGYLATTLPAR